MNNKDSKDSNNTEDKGLGRVSKIRRLMSPADIVLWAELIECDALQKNLGCVHGMLICGDLEEGADGDIVALVRDVTDAHKKAQKDLTKRILCPNNAQMERHMRWHLSDMDSFAANPAPATDRSDITKTAGAAVAGAHLAAVWTLAGIATTVIMERVPLTIEAMKRYRTELNARVNRRRKELLADAPHGVALGKGKLCVEKWEANHPIWLIEARRGPNTDA